MKITDYYNLLNGNKASEGEKIFLQLLPEIFNTEVLDYLENEVQICEDLSSTTDGKSKYIDFVLKTKDNEFAIEIQSTKYHAQEHTTSERYNSLVEKNNYLHFHYGAKYMEFTYKHLTETPDYVKNIIRRTVCGDEILRGLYLGSDIQNIHPHKIQKEALKRILDSRKNGEDKALCVMATGIGKTYMAAFDVLRFKPKKLLFIVHREEILKKSLKSFHDVIGGDINHDYGLFNKDNKNIHKKYLFASVQSLTKRNLEKYFDKKMFDYIVVDETHHIAAKSYQYFYKFFDPKFTLGLTATPIRTDEKDILNFYNNKSVFEISLNKCIELGYLTPFKYIALEDNVDYSNIKWNGRKYDLNDLNKKLMIKERDFLIIQEYRKIVENFKHAIGFCTSIEHADYMTEIFNNNGIRAVSIHSRMTNREDKIKDFDNHKYEVAFSVDIFNEGVDFKTVNILLFLRPTESKVLFQQHLGRGLRLSNQKFETIILDFIGNHNQQKIPLESLGLELDKLTKDEKDVYWYTLNGITLKFDKKIIEQINLLTLQTEKIVDKDVGAHWVSYRKFLRKQYEDNLYWNIGHQQRDIPTNLRALEIINKNPSIKDNELIKQMDPILKAGTRGLIFCKHIGLLYKKNGKWVTNKVLDNVFRDGNYEESSSYIDRLSDQFEKYYYFNLLTHSKVNKWKSEQIDYSRFGIFPIFAIYQYLIRIHELGESAPHITEDEFKFFINVTQSHEEINDYLINHLLEYRRLDTIQKNKVRKYLIQKDNRFKGKLDDRFYNYIHLSKYLIVENGQIKVRQKMLDSLIEKVNEFEKLYNNNRLITWDHNSPDIYANFLRSDQDFLAYHTLNHSSQSV